jgi:hypothetical protein
VTEAASCGGGTGVAAKVRFVAHSSMALRFCVRPPRRVEKRVAEQARSGLSVAAFCRQRRLTESQFFTWKRRLRQAVAEPFMEVRVEEPTAGFVPAQSRAIEVRLDSGRRVFVEPGFEAGHLRAVLPALEAQV